MRAALLTEPAPIDARPLRQVELPDPSPGRGELLLNVAACAVCRTDLQIVEGDLQPRLLPLVPGHQIVGTVSEVGPGVSGWAAGDVAGVGWLGATCGECRFCASQRENLCEHVQFTGWDRPGGFASRVAVVADYAFHFPAGADPARLAPLLCGGVIGYRSLIVSGIERGGRLGLFGFGASARLALQVARYWGCEVYVVTRSAPDRATAQAMGAEWVGSYDDTVPAALDAAVTFAPAGDVVVAALSALDRGGTVAINAIHLDRLPGFDYELLWWERKIRSVANYTRRDAHEFLAIARECEIETNISRYPLGAANEALLATRDGSLGGTAVLTID